jgi:hypothetical protein
MTGLAMSVYEWLFARATEVGSRQLVWSALGIPDGGLEELRGAYVGLSGVDEPSDFVLGEKGKEREDKLWVGTIGFRHPAFTLLIPVRMTLYLSSRMSIRK